MAYAVGQIIGFIVGIWIIIKSIKFVTSLFSSSNTSVSENKEREKKTTEISGAERKKHYQNILHNADAFASLARKIGMGGKGSVAFPVTFRLQTEATGLVRVYATHTIHDDDWMDFAFNRAREGDRSGTEYAYNKMIEQYGLTDTELRSFQDVSDFMEVLRGGISGYNSCSRSGNDIEIRQELGVVQSYDKGIILKRIGEHIANIHSGIRKESFGTTALAIYFM